MRTLPRPARMLALLLALLAAAMGAVAAAPQRAHADASGPGAGTVAGIQTVTLLPASATTGAGTAYTASPKLIKGVDVSKTARWHSADVFVTVDLASTGTVTATVQASPDATNWSDAYYNAVVGSTPAVAAQTYQLVFTADGTKHLTLPLAGEYSRVKLVRTADMTATVQLTLRNDGGVVTP